MQSSTDEPQRATQGLIAPSFPDAHAVKRSCLVPPETMSSLSTSRSPLPGHPGPRTTEPLRPANFTYFEALIPLWVRSRQPERTRTDGRYSLGFLPLQRPSRASEPQPRPAPRNWTRAVTRRLWLATPGTTAP